VQGLSVENAGYLLEMANRFQAQHLKALALEYMVQHRHEFESVPTALVAEGSAKRVVRSHHALW
jgi:hypothetical protein